MRVATRLRFGPFLALALTGALGISAAERAYAAPSDADAVDDEWDPPEPVPPESAASYEAAMARLAPHPRPFRAAVESLIGLAPLAARYFVSPGPHANNPDWDHASVGDRLTQMVTPGFDTDAIVTNGLAHPIGGAFFYEIARSNDLGPVPSFFYTVGTSLVWEYGVEYRMPPSLNDLLFTPIGGFPIGEGFARLGSYFDRSSCCRAAAWILFPQRKINDAIDGRHRPKTPWHDTLGLPTDAWHRFELTGGIGVAAADDGSGHPWGGVRAESELLDVPEAGSSGTASRGLGPGTSTELDADLSFEPEGLYQFDFFAKSMLVGHYSQSLTNVPFERPSGTRLTFGAATAFEYYSHRFVPMGLDTLAILKVLGPSLDVALLGHSYSFRVALDAYADFAAVHSELIESALAARGLTGYDVRSYFFAFGGSARLRAYGSFHALRAGVTLDLDGFAAAEDTFPVGEHATNHFGLSKVDLSGSQGSSMRFSQHGFVAYRPPGTYAEVPRIDIEHVQRSERLDGLPGDREDTRVLVGAGAQF